CGQNPQPIWRRRRSAPSPARAAPSSTIDEGSGTWLGRPGEITDSEQVMDAPIAVWVQVSELEAFWPTNCAAVPVPPMIVPLNCCEMLPFVAAPLGTIKTEEILVKRNTRPRVPAESVKGVMGPGVVL